MPKVKSSDLHFFFQPKPYNSFLFTSFDCVIFLQCSLWVAECESIQLNFIAQARAEFACQIGSLFDVRLSKEMNTQQFWRCKTYLCSRCQFVWTSGVTFFWFQWFTGFFSTWPFVLDSQLSTSKLRLNNFNYSPSVFHLQMIKTCYSSQIGEPKEYLSNFKKILFDMRNNGLIKHTNNVRAILIQRWIHTTRIQLQFNNY